MQVVVRHGAGGMLADRFEHVLHRDILALVAAGQDRAAIHEDEGTLRRTIAIIMPGSDLSQPARPTSAS
jgi:hypothetical protein